MGGNRAVNKLKDLGITLAVTIVAMLVLAGPGPTGAWMSATANLAGSGLDRIAALVNNAADAVPAQ